MLNAKLERVGNAVKIKLNSNIYEPLSFKSFRPTERNISDFYKAGIRLFDILSTGTRSMLGAPYSLFGESWIGEYEYDFSAIDNQIDFFIKNAPDAYFMLMLAVDTREWWLKDNPEYVSSFEAMNVGGKRRRPIYKERLNTWRKNTAIKCTVMPY